MVPPPLLRPSQRRASGVLPSFEMQHQLSLARAPFPLAPVPLVSSDLALPRAADCGGRSPGLKDPTTDRASNELPSTAGRQQTTGQCERQISRRTSHEQHVVRCQPTAYWPSTFGHELMNPYGDRRRLTVGRHLQQHSQFLLYPNERLRIDTLARKRKHAATIAFLQQLHERIRVKCFLRRVRKLQQLIHRPVLMKGTNAERSSRGVRPGRRSDRLRLVFLRKYWCRRWESNPHGLAATGF